MAKIERVEDLPDWFDLAKYSECETFGAVAWLEQLERRQELLELHPSRVHVSIPEDPESWQTFLFDFWKHAMHESTQKVRYAPLDSPSNGKIYEWMASPNSQPIRKISAEDLAWQIIRDRDAERAGKVPLGLSTRWDAINPDKVSAFTFISYIEAPLSINHYKGALEIPIIQVDVGASDAVLKAAFSAWLKTVRGSQKAELPKRPKALYGRWARYGVLPYLDLMIWSMETGIHIPDRVMSAAISTYDAGEANLRKTVAPLAEGLLRDLSELQALAAIEATNQAPEYSETSAP